MDGANVDEYNTEIIPVADNVDESYPTSPGISLCKYRQHTFWPVCDQSYLTDLDTHNNTSDGSSVLHVGMHSTPS